VPFPEQAALRLRVTARGVALDVERSALYVSVALCRGFPSFLTEMHEKRLFFIENHRKTRKTPDQPCTPQASEERSPVI
jgi:hypothetical protein